MPLASFHPFKFQKFLYKCFYMVSTKSGGQFVKNAKVVVKVAKSCIFQFAKKYCKVWLIGHNELITIINCQRYYNFFFG